MNFKVVSRLSNTPQIIKLSQHWKLMSTARISHPEYCMNIVRKYDYESYLATLLLSKSIRRNAFALRAFNVEIAQIKDVTSKQEIGEMRMEFWKQSIMKIFEDDPPKTPVASEIYRIVKEHRVPKRYFTTLLEARRRHLSSTPFLSLQQVENYADQTQSSILYLLLECAGIRDLNADHAASHIGQALGLTAHIRSVTYHAQKHEVYLPTELMALHGVSQNEVLKGNCGQNMKDLIFEIASKANYHLETAKSLESKIPKNAFPLFLPMVSTELYLTAVQKADFNVFNKQLQQRNPWLPVKLWFRKIKSAF